jgi:biopolymer transport protein ExbD
MGIPLVLPGKQSSDVKVNRKNLLEVKAYPNGSVVIEDKQVPLNQIRPLVERELAANEKLIVVIQTHPDAEYGLMIDILDELKLANARRISLKTMQAQ